MLDLIKGYFSRKQQDVYCQNCGDELTERGGDVSSSGRIYCHGYEGVDAACGIKAMFKWAERGEMFSLNFYMPDQAQKAILKKELISFGRLEQVIGSSR